MQTSRLPSASHNDEGKLGSMVEPDQGRKVFLSFMFLEIAPWTRSATQMNITENADLHHKSAL
jgi:hypothetical protein